jgi:hypothetical protein
MAMSAKQTIISLLDSLTKEELKEISIELKKRTEEDSDKEDESDKDSDKENESDEESDKDSDDDDKHYATCAKNDRIRITTEDLRLFMEEGYENNKVSITFRPYDELTPAEKDTIFSDLEGIDSEHNKNFAECPECAFNDAISYLVDGDNTVNADGEYEILKLMKPKFTMKNGKDDEDTLEWIDKLTNATKQPKSLYGVEVEYEMGSSLIADPHNRYWGMDHGDDLVRETKAYKGKNSNDEQHVKILEELPRDSRYYFWALYKLKEIAEEKRYTKTQQALKPLLYSILSKEKLDDPRFNRTRKEFTTVLLEYAPNKEEKEVYKMKLREMELKTIELRKKLLPKDEDDEEDDGTEDDGTDV